MPMTPPKPKKRKMKKRELLYQSRFKNASFEAWVYASPIPREDPSDRIELIIRPARGRILRYLFNVMDCLEVMAALSYASAWAVDHDDIPVLSAPIRKPKR